MSSNYTKKFGHRIKRRQLNMHHERSSSLVNRRAFEKHLRANGCNLHHHGGDDMTCGSTWQTASRRQFPDTRVSRSRAIVESANNSISPSPMGFDHQLS